MTDSVKPSMRTTQGTGAGAVKEHGKRPGNWAGVEFMVEFVLSMH